MKSEPLVNLLKQAQLRGFDQLLVEVYMHPDRSFSVYLDNVLMPAHRVRHCGERRPDSTLVARSFAKVAEFARVHDVFAFLDDSDPQSSGAPQGPPVATAL